MKERAMTEALEESKKKEAYTQPPHKFHFNSFFIAHVAPSQNTKKTVHNFAPYLCAEMHS